MQYSIYSIQNIINGKIYIGFTKDVEQRFYKHKWYGSRGSGPCKRLYPSMKKHGVHNFTFTVLEENIETIECAREREQFYIEKHESYTKGYNANHGGSGGDMSHLKSYQDAIKLVHENKHSSEYATYGMLGKNHSEETKEKQAIARKAYWDSLTDEERDERASKTKGSNNPMFGRIPTNATKILFRGTTFNSIAEAVRTTGHSAKYIKQHGTTL